MAQAGPSKGRFAERLRAASIEQLIELAAQACHALPDARRYADACLAVRAPLLQDEVLLSRDLLPQLFASLELEDCAAAATCRAWSVAWADTKDERRVLRPAPLLEPDFGLDYPSALSALPRGERLCIADFNAKRVRVVDQQMRLQHTLGDGASGVKFNGRVSGLAAGDGGLYVSEWDPARVRRFQLDTFAVATELTFAGHYGFHALALAPGGPLFAVALRKDLGGRQPYQLLALDALTLEARFTVGKDVLGGGILGGLAVCGDELFVGDNKDGSIRVLSLAGEPRRTIAAGGWRRPRSLCCVADRLYLIEYEAVCPEKDDEAETQVQKAGRRVFVLTPEGASLQVYSSPKPPGESVVWRSMCNFDGKLVVAEFAEHTHRELFALRL